MNLALLMMQLNERQDSQMADTETTMKATTEQNIQSLKQILAEKESVLGEMKANLQDGQHERHVT